MNPGPLHWVHRVVATKQPGKSLVSDFLTGDLIAVLFTSIKKAPFSLPTPVPNFNYTKYLSRTVQPDSSRGGGERGAVSIHNVFALWNNYT